MYYTKDGRPSLTPQTEEDRFDVWVKKISDRRLITTYEYKNGRRIKVQRGVGPGIDEPTEEELQAVYGKPCRYRRAALANRA